MLLRRLLFIPLLLGTCLTGAGTHAGRQSVVEWLDRYAAGEFEAVAGELSATTDFGEILEQLRRDGPGWIDAAGPDAGERRELAAATFALEAARAGAWHEWKFIQRQPRMCAPNGECTQPPSVLYWKAPPLLIEWGCERLRRRDTPLRMERWWQLAALAVAQRSEDPQFLVGDPSIGGGIGSAEIVNIQDEIKHLEHTRPRFPAEMRFVLAEGIARDRVWPDDAARVYRALEDDPDVGGEATMRLGAMQVMGRSRNASTSDALARLEKAETLTRDPYVVFLARYFKGRVQERQRRTQQAEAAYRGAVAAVPHAQSATIALASLVFRDGRRSDAQRLIRDMLTADPRPADPWRGYVHADDRFWPQLITRLREEIGK